MRNSARSFLESSDFRAGSSTVEINLWTIKNILEKMLEMQHFYKRKFAKLQNLNYQNIQEWQQTVDYFTTREDNTYIKIIWQQYNILKYINLVNRTFIRNPNMLYSFLLFFYSSDAAWGSMTFKSRVSYAESWFLCKKYVVLLSFL